MIHDKPQWYVLNIHLVYCRNNSKACQKKEEYYDICILVFLFGVPSLWDSMNRPVGGRRY